MSNDLNVGQTKAAEGLLEFLFSTETEMVLTGPPGTGKTHWMKHAINVVIPNYFQTCEILGIDPRYTETAITATTNKAAEVLGEMTGWECKTVHSFMNLTVTNNFATGETELKPSRNYRVQSNAIIFIDECSMIDRNLYKYLTEGTTNCKLIYIGDKDQLAPVRETISPVFTKGFRTVELTEPMRTKDPHLQALNKQLKETVETGVFNPVKIVPGVIDWLNDDDLEKALDYYYRQQSSDHRILAYTNKRVIAYNDHIRAMRGLPNEPTPGEKLVNAQYIAYRDVTMPVEVEYTIVDIDPKITEIDVEEDVTLKVMTVTLEKKNGVRLYGIKIPQDPSHLVALIEYYRKKKSYPKMSSLRDVYAQLRPRDAATVHKGQGSTYDTVIVDLGNISSCHKADEVARMLYVAFSRARTRVMLYGQLAPKYGGLIHP